MLALRQARGVTQLVAAEAIGISGKQLRRVELGQANVTLGTLLACALFYKVDLQGLFAEDEVSGTRPRARTLPQEQARLSERVRGLRGERGLTQEEAAERIGVSVIQYGRLERARANISLATLVAVAVAFRVRLGELFDG